jgi:hypothetical protein
MKGIRWLFYLTLIAIGYALGALGTYIFHLK